MKIGVMASEMQETAIITLDSTVGSKKPVIRTLHQGHSAEAAKRGVVSQVDTPLLTIH